MWKVKKNISLFEIYMIMYVKFIISFESLSRSYGYLNQFHIYLNKDFSSLFVL